MKKGGIGGHLTKTGLRFEERVDVLRLFNRMKSYDVKDNVIYYKHEPVAESYKKHELYRYLQGRGIDYTKILSRKLLPDDSLYVRKNKTFFIIEVKFQEVEGSTDEKLQTCDFKIKQYKKLLKGLGVKVKYVYVLNNWFKKSRYRDVLEYIRSVEDCDYFLNALPLKYLNLPSS